MHVSVLLISSTSVPFEVGPDCGAGKKPDYNTTTGVITGYNYRTKFFSHKLAHSLEWREEGGLEKRNLV